MNPEWWPRLDRMKRDGMPPQPFTHTYYGGKRTTVYTVDFDAMTQRSHDNGRERRIRALMQVSPALDAGFEPPPPPPTGGDTASQPASSQGSAPTPTGQPSPTAAPPTGGFTPGQSASSQGSAPTAKQPAAPPPRPTRPPPTADSNWPAGGSNPWQDYV